MVKKDKKTIITSNVIKKYIRDIIKNNIIITILVGSIISIILGILVGSSLAKYQEEKIIKVFANIAKPVLEIEKQESFKITNENSKDSYLFEVRNYNEKEISEVEMQYYIEILTDFDEFDKTIKIDLYKGEEKIDLINNKTPVISLTKENKDNHMYRLDIEYIKENDKSDENIIKDVEIKVNAMQKI